MIPIVFQNDQVVVIDKPSGYLSVPSRRGTQDPRPVVGLILREQLAKKIFPVHRLDFEVSGIMVFALEPKAHRALNRAFEKREVTKRYQAFSKGGDFSVGLKGTWTSRIVRGKKRAYERPWGDLAVTQFEVVGQYAPDYYEWNLFPKTGRSHQLRFELFRHGSPILGDTLYGGAKWGFVVSPFGKETIALRAVSLIFKPGLAESLGLSPEIQVSPLPRPF
jgi:tRNA pseudouridine32 synthase/23S rRNA pseudouridine746 synthase